MRQFYNTKYGYMVSWYQIKKKQNIGVSSLELFVLGVFG